MKPNMYDNFKLLESRVIDTLEKTDLEKIKKELEKITTPTICTGVGGSNVVSNFASKVLSSKNGCLTINSEPRDLLYMNLANYENVISCSYGGNNYGVKTAFNNELKKYLLTTNPRPGVTNLEYSSTIEQENSFISLAATLMPMSILLAYYMDNDLSLIKEVLETKKDYQIIKSNLYEIMSGYETSTAATFLESTLTESGIAIPLVSDKYGYCHGRSTLSYNNQASAIIYNRNTELDNKFLTEFPKYYQEVIKIDSKYQDQIKDDFYFTYQSMLLAKAIAENTNQDLSRVNYSPLVKKLYYYKGGM